MVSYPNRVGQGCYWLSRSTNEWQSIGVYGISKESPFRITVVILESVTITKKYYYQELGKRVRLLKSYCWSSGLGSIFREWERRKKHLGVQAGRLVKHWWGSLMPLLPTTLEYLPPEPRDTVSVPLTMYNPLSRLEFKFSDYMELLLEGGGSGTPILQGTLDRQ